MCRMSWRSDSLTVNLHNYFFQLWKLSSDIPAVERGLFTKYNARVCGLEL